MVIATAADAGLTSRLVQRLELRIEPTKASPPAASTAAVGPCISNSRKMKISPAANEFFDPGMRTGYMPAIIATTQPIRICSWMPGGWVVSWAAANNTATHPTVTTVHQ